MTLVYLTIAWAGGIWLTHLLWSYGLIGCSTPGWPFGACAAVAAFCLAAFRRSPRARLVLLLLAVLFLGGWRYHGHPLALCSTPRDLAFYNGDARHAVQATVEGLVVGYPDVRDTLTQYRLRVSSLTLGESSQAVQGDVLVQASRYPAFAYGDRLRVSGQLLTPPVLDDFDYRAYLARQGIHSLLRRAQVERLAQNQGSPFWTALYGLRASGSTLLNRVLPEPSAALANGMLLGIDTAIPPEVDAAFKITGTSHVIVISGSNISLLSAVLLTILGGIFGRRRGALLAIGGIILYVLLVGADTAAQRAGVMGALYVLAMALGRQSTALISLFASALLITALNPLTLGDVGFQLSFMATLGLILFTTPIQLRVEGLLSSRLPPVTARKVMGLLSGALIVTLAAQIMTLPLTVYHFGRLSPISLLANFLILPAQPPIMMGGMATLMGGWAWEPLGRVLAAIPLLFLTYTTAIVRWMASVPWASVETGSPGRALALVYYGVVFGALGMRWLAPVGWDAWPKRRTLVLAGAIALPLWLGVNAIGGLPDGRLHVSYVSQDSGEAVLVVTPEGRRAWIWDGRGNGAVLAGMAKPMLNGWRQSVDLAIGPGAGQFWQGAQEIAPARTPPGTTVRLDDGVSLRRLPGDENGIWILDYGNFRMMLPSSIKPPAQEAMLKSTDPAHLRTVLFKLPDAGTGAWPTVPFLAATAPQIVLWPEETTYPPGTVEWLAAHGAATIPSGAQVEVITDGKQAWLHLRDATGKR